MTMMRLLVAATLMIAPVSASADAFSDAAGRYKVQSSSVIHFSVAQMGGQAIEGTFKRFKGTFQLDGKDVGRSKVDISIDAGSVSAADPRIEEFIKSEPVFDAAKYPTVSFHSSGAKRNGAKSATVEGQLSAKGRTRPARFAVTLNEQSGNTLKFHVTGKLSRALFGMDVGTPVYSNMVVLDMTLVGRKQ
jgi:polyisoprenoid-binding protein YceI